MAESNNEREAAERVRIILAKPLAEDRQMMDVETFDPWEIFPSLYGSYSSEFDDLAIAVLRDIQTSDWQNMRSDLAAEMFREMLCTSNLCEYGTSPRVCFATPQFAEIVPELIKKWSEYRSLIWEA